MSTSPVTRKSNWNWAQLYLFHMKYGKLLYLTLFIFNIVLISLMSSLVKTFNFATLYSQVIWKPSEIKFENRFDKYLDPSFFQHRVRVHHWCLPDNWVFQPYQMAPCMSSTSNVHIIMSVGLSMSSRWTETLVNVCLFYCII